ncbi:MAG: ATP-binding protein [bacterium]|nr:ATP-binding protein [bacterium]
MINTLKPNSESDFDIGIFQLAVENASDHIIITDDASRILYANPAAEKITGYSQTEMIGQTPALWGKQMEKKFYQKLWQTIKKEKKAYHGTFINQRKSGERYYAQVDIAPIFDKNKKIKYYVGIERDITEQFELDKMKTEFISLASHQLRAPLAIIKWHASALMQSKNKNFDQNQNKYINEIYQGNQRMIELVNALLYVSRIELGKLIIKPKKINLSDIIRTCLDGLEPTIKAKKLKIKKEFSNNLNIKIDPDLMHYIIDNLVSNAVKYTQANGRVRVKVEKNKLKVIISVADNGMGIPKSQQNKIFSKLFRADNVVSKDADGTGLGLYIVKSIVELIGGQISFKSAINKGSEFRVYLPLSK